MINFIKAMFSERSGRPSSMRFLSFIVVLQITGVWTYTSIKSGHCEDMKVELVELVVGVLGVKAFQRGRENDTLPQTLPPKQTTP